MLVKKETCQNDDTDNRSSYSCFEVSCHPGRESGDEQRLSALVYDCYVVVKYDSLWNNQLVKEAEMSVAGGRESRSRISTAQSTDRLLPAM